MTIPTHLALRTLRLKTGLSTDAFAKKLGFRGGSSYQRYESPEGYKRRKFITPELAQKIEDTFLGKGDPPITKNEIDNLAGIKTAPAEILDVAEPANGKPRSIAVVGEVAAGVWVEVWGDEQREITEWLNIEVPGYERVQLKAWRVRGPSMNLRYPEGSFVITCSTAEAGIRHGDDVVVMRRNAVGYEYTVKEIVLKGKQIWLQPRSSDPLFQKPWQMKRGDEQSDDGMEIVEVVVADYRTRQRPPGPLLQFD